MSPLDVALAAATWDERAAAWEVALATAEGETVGALVATEGDAREGPVTAEARAALGRFAERAGALRALAADDETVRLFNEVWREGGEAPITREGLRAALALDGLHVDPDGASTVYFATGDLFGGHLLELRLAPDGTPTEPPGLAG